MPKMLWVGSVEVDGMLLILITRRRPASARKAAQARWAKNKAGSQ